MQRLPVYAINLDRRPDRWMRCQQEINLAGFTNVTRVSGIDGKLIDMKQVEALTGVNVFDKLGQLRQSDEELGTVGAVGCYLSHMKVWQLIQDQNVPALVIEDDIKINAGKLKEWPTLNQLAPFDFILFGYGMVNVPKSSMSSSLIKYKGPFTCTHFYYLTPEGAKFFLTGALPIQQQVDWYMAAKLKNIPSIPAAIHVPKLADQHQAKTDIQIPVRVLAPQLKNGWFRVWLVSLILFVIIAIILWRKKCRRR